MSHTRKSLIALMVLSLVTLFTATVMAQTRTTHRTRKTGESGTTVQGVKSQDKATTATTRVGAKEKKGVTAKGMTHGTMMRKQTRCPIDHKKIDKKFYSDKNGKRIYFCSSECKKEFDKNPTKYMKQMKDRHIELEKTHITEGK